MALTWDFRTLLIPSLLPVTESDPENKIALKLATKAQRRRRLSCEGMLSDDTQDPPNLVTGEVQPLTRLLLISYFPSGFWSRLMIRILADTQIGEMAQNVYQIPTSISEPSTPNEVNAFQWRLWQSGLALCCGDQLIFKLHEILLHSCDSPYRQLSNKYKIKQDGIWSDIDLSRSSILQIFVPLESMKLDGLTIPVNLQHVTKLLSLCVDHIDILLEDWYPTLGTRFVHTSEGRFLVTRLIPCPHCISKALKVGKRNEMSATNSRASSMENLLSDPVDDKKVSECHQKADLENELEFLFVNISD